MLAAVEPIDPFADPFDGNGDVQPMLVLLDDDKLPDRLRGVAVELASLADSVGVRVARISSGDPDLPASDVERYVTMLQHGLYGAEYLGIGLCDD